MEVVNCRAGELTSEQRQKLGAILEEVSRVSVELGQHVRDDLSSRDVRYEGQPIVDPPVRYTEHYVIAAKVGQLSDLVVELSCLTPWDPSECGEASYAMSKEQSKLRAQHAKWHEEWGLRAAATGRCTCGEAPASAF